MNLGITRKPLGDVLEKKNQFASEEQKHELDSVQGKQKAPWFVTRQPRPEFLERTPACSGFTVIPRNLKPVKFRLSRLKALKFIDLNISKKNKKSAKAQLFRL